jgi:hypothetical protein
VANPIEEDPLPVDVIANAVVADSNSPLADRHVGEVLTLIGIVVEPLEGFQHAPMDGGIETAEIATKVIRDDQLKARHVRSASSRGAPWRGGLGEARRGS